MTDIVKLIESCAASDPRLKAVLKKIRNGKASFTDTAYYAEVYSEITGKVFSSAILELDADEREAVCMEILHGNYEAVNDVCVQVQTSLDSESGINIKPQRAPFPTERVAAVAHALTDPSVPEKTIKRRAKAPVANVSKSFHDDYIRKNAAFRNDAGLDVYIVRMGTGCCKWCSEVSGKYKFGSQPDDIFRRHDNCDCTIIYDNQVLRGKKKSDGSRSKTWEEIPNAPDEYSPTVLSEQDGRELQQRNLSRFRGLTNSGNGGKIKAEGVKPMIISSIDSPIEQRHNGKGNPNAINIFGAELNNRQKSLLEKLPEFDSRVIVPRDSVNMSDLAALTAETGSEFAMFTRKGDRLVIRGNTNMVNIDIESAMQLAEDGYRWSGHTHPGMDFLAMQPSDGDYAILDCFRQETSVIYNSKGDFRTFERRK